MLQSSLTRTSHPYLLFIPYPKNQGEFPVHHPEFCKVIKRNCMWEAPELQGKHLWKRDSNGAWMAAGISTSPSGSYNRFHTKNYFYFNITPTSSNCQNLFSLLARSQQSNVLKKLLIISVLSARHIFKKYCYKSRESSDLFQLCSVIFGSQVKLQLHKFRTLHNWSKCISLNLWIRHR